MIRPLGAMAGLALVACNSVIPTPSPGATVTHTSRLTPSATDAASPSPFRTSSTTPKPPQGSFDPATLDGRIVFAHEGDVWVMNADGTRRVRLTDDPEQDFDPAWSPDGTQIAFRAHRDGNEEVYLMAADGSDQRNLTDNPRTDYSPAWSPDGARIAFASDRDPDSGGNDVYVIDIQTGEVTRLTTGGGIDEYPTWSPDGLRIAYACSHGVLPEGTADFEVCAMDADGTNQEQLTDAEGLSDYPAWSPDGAHIAFHSTRGGWPTLPDYVPLGYERGEFGEYDVYLMNVDGSDVRNVTDNGRESEQFPAWSTDGRHLVFSRYGCLVAKTVEGLSEATLTKDVACADSFPDWAQ